MEAWEKKLQAAGYRVIHEPTSTEPEKPTEEKTDPSKLKPIMWTMAKARQP